MANVIKTVLTYQLDGSNRDFNIPFEYLARKFVVVTLIGVDRKVLTINTDYRFATRTTISLTKAWGPSDGYTTIELRRVTSTTDRLVDFTDGSILRAYDLNVAQIQTMHVAEEARDLTADTIGVNNDGHLDARGRRIVNLANAVDDRDAVPFGQLKIMNQNSWQARNEAQGFRNEAETFRNQAEGFKNESSTNATNTKQWRDEAEQFKNMAGQYADAAGSSAGNAKDSEDEARRIAERIKAAGLVGYITRRSFEKGFNVTTWNEALLWEEDGNYYRWDGELPKVVPAGSTPDTTGGVKLGAWVSVGDAALRSELNNQDIGAKLIKAPIGGGSVYDMLWYVTPAQFSAPEDGSDASVQLQAMLDYALINGKAVLFDKAVTYNINKPLVYKQRGFRNSRILCYGGRTVINLNSSTATSGLPNDESGIVMDVNAAIVVSSTNPDTAVVNQPQAVYIEGLQFTSTAGGSYGIYLGKTQNTNINDCKFTGFTEADICDNGSWVFRVHGCQLFSSAHYGIWKKAGTSAWITECYFQNSNYAVRMKSGYSVISKCANDFTKNAAYWLESSDYNSVYTIDECGFENSGSDAVVKVSGRVALTWSNCMAGNIESQQSPIPTNLLWVQGDSNGSQFTLSNIRFLNTGRRIWDLGTNSRFTINRVNHASGDLADVWGTGALINENTYNTTKYMSAAYPNGFRIGATGLSDWFASGGNTGSLPNDQRFLRYSKTITRTPGKSFGTITITLPFQLSADHEGYQVIVTPRAYPNNVPTEQWHCASYNHTSTDVMIIAGRGDGNTAWSTVIVDILIIGKAINF